MKTPVDKNNTTEHPLKHHNSAASSALPADTYTQTTLDTHRQLKAQAYRRNLAAARQQLSPVARAFSGIIHLPVIEVSCTALAKAIGRPIGLLLGAIASLATSCVFIYVCKHYGFQYNYLIAPSAFVVGYIVGLILEATLRLTRKRS